MWFMCSLKMGWNSFSKRQYVEQLDKFKYVDMIDR